MAACCSIREGSSRSHVGKMKLGSSSIGGVIVKVIT